MMPDQFHDKRRFLGVRKLVGDAAPLPKAALRWAARQMTPSDLAELDRMMGMRAQPSRAQNPQTIQAPPEPENLRSLFFSATPEQQTAIRYVVGKMGPVQVAELEALVGRNGRYLRKPQDGK